MSESEGKLHEGQVEDSLSAIQSNIALTSIIVRVLVETVSSRYEKFIVNIGHGSNTKTPYIGTK